MALDTLSIPAMSTECERVFSSTKKLLAPDAEWPQRGYHRGNRVPKSLVGLWDDQPMRAQDFGDDEVFSSIYIPYNTSYLPRNAFLPDSDISLLI
jgi:hypothetical protein